MELYQHVSTETIWREYKEAVLSRPDTMVDKDDLDALLRGELTVDLNDKIMRQLLSDLSKYIPRYATCFLNSSRRKYYSWYYGITDDGYLGGFPVLMNQWVEMQRDIMATFQHLLNEHITLIIPDSHFWEHQNIEGCQLTHDLLTYEQDGRLQVGYTCEKLKKLTTTLINFQIIPLARPLNKYPKIITNLRNRWHRNHQDVRHYRESLQRYDKEYAEWLNKFVYYSNKIDTLLKDPEILRELQEYIRGRTRGRAPSPFNPLSAEPPSSFVSSTETRGTTSPVSGTHLSSSKLSSALPLEEALPLSHSELTRGKCFPIGNDICIPDPPFLEIFRGFRDSMRNKMRLIQPQPPIKRIKDITKLIMNRQIFLGNFLIDNPQVNFFIFKMSVRSLGLNSIYRAIYRQNEKWFYQNRLLKGKIPSCIG